MPQDFQYSSMWLLTEPVTDCDRFREASRLVLRGRAVAEGVEGVFAAQD